MATYVDQAYFDWAHDDVTHQDDSQEVSASQILDHGSISFGRFAHESLSWERRSVFTHNKCQEELEKFKCPGLVAKKKAYFEEYYKRIRATKESQENQQTELTLDYGGDESISSQNGEEDEIVARLGKLGEEATNIVGDHPDEASLEISVEKEKEKEIVEVQNRQSDPITTTIGPGSLRSDFDDLEQEDYTKYPLELEEASVEVSMVKEILEVQSRHSDAETTTVNLDSSRRNSEDHELQDKTMYPLEQEEASAEFSMVKEILEVQSRHSDAETTTVDLDSLRRNSEDHEQQDKTMYPLQMQHLDTENQDYESLTRITEVTEQHDFDNLDKEDSSGEHSVIHMDPDGASKATELHPSSSKLGDFELKSAKKMVSGKVSPHVRNHKDHVSIHRVKEPSAAGRSGSKMEKTKPDIVKPPQGPKNASERTPKKSGILAGSSKTSSDRVSRHCKSFFTPSHRPLTEVQSSVTVTRPFSLATDRQAAVLSSNRDGPTKSDQKASNKRIPLAVHRKDVNVQGSLKRNIFLVGAESRGLENKRCHEERKNPLPLDRERIGLKDRSANLPELPRARSVNLPPRKNCNSSSGIDNRIKGDHRANAEKEEKSDGRLREASRTGRRVAATPPARNLGCESKKVIPSWTGNHSINGRKHPFGGQSLDGKKPRQEKPRWR